MARRETTKPRGRYDGWRLAGVFPEALARQVQSHIELMDIARQLEYFA